MSTKKYRPQRQKQTAGKVRQVQELRRSNASGPINIKRFPEPQISDWISEPDDEFELFDFLGKDSEDNLEETLDITDQDS